MYITNRVIKPFIIVNFWYLWVMFVNTFVVVKYNGS